MKVQKISPKFHYLDFSQRRTIRAQPLVENWRILAVVTELVPRASSFPKDLMSLGTGVIAEEMINYHLSQEKVYSALFLGDFQAVKFKQRERVQPLAIMNSSIQIQDMAVVINSITLF